MTDSEDASGTEESPASEGTSASEADQEVETDADTEAGADAEGSTTTTTGDSDSDSDSDSGSDTSDPDPTGETCDSPLWPGGMPPGSAGFWEDRYDKLTYCEGESSRTCTTSEGESGTSICVVSWGGEIWTECSVEHECTPDDVFKNGECQGSYCAIHEGVLDVDYWTSDDPCCGTDDPCCYTPIVVNFDRAPLRFETAGAAAFDISGVGACLSTDWPSAPWLAIDRDGDGVIGSGRELFGSGTIMSSGVRAEHGFEALAEFDVDGDGQITAADPIFHELVLWADHDNNRRGTLDELAPVSSAELVAIDLSFSRRYDCDARGNCGVERSTFEFRDELGMVRSGELIDVHLPCQ